MRTVSKSVSTGTARRGPILLFLLSQLFVTGSMVWRVPDDPILAGILPGWVPPERVLVKAGVILRGLDERMYPVIEQAREIWRRFGQPLVITSGLDGPHKKGSLHYAGLALDFRTKYLSPASRRGVAQALRNVLGSGFQVLVERDHIHVEHDRPPPARSSTAAPNGSGRKTVVAIRKSR
jgi:hypothetical protein